MAIRVRALSSGEAEELARMARSRTLGAGLVRRAQIVRHAVREGLSAPEVAARMGLCGATVRFWLKRFNERGLQGLEGDMRSGRVRPPTRPRSGARSSPPPSAVRPSRACPSPRGRWTGRSPTSASRRASACAAVGSARCCWPRASGGARRRPGSARGSTRTSRVKGGHRAAPHRGAGGRRSRLPRRDGAAGQQGLSRAAPGQAGPAPPGRSGPRGRSTTAGAVPRATCSAPCSRPATGAAFTATCERRTTANWVDFLGQVEGWIGPTAERVDAVVDNLDIHGGTDVLLFALAHPRWEFVFQPKYAAYLTLIEPWWKVLRSLALKGRRFEAWAGIEQAVERATAYWNGHRNPFIWGRRRRHRTPRRLGIAAPPNVAFI